MKAILVAGAALAALVAVGSADAQPRGDRGGGGRPQITLYAQPDFQGPSRTWSAGVDNLADQGFNDFAQSARVEGRWRVCEDSKLRGRCVELSGDVPNLAVMRMTVAISSFENLGGGFGGGRPGNGPGGNNGGGFGGGNGGPGPGPGGGFGGGNFGGQRVDGRSVSFFPNPQPGPYRNADDFCRRMGFAGVVYADDRGQLRDVVCRR